MKKWEDIIKDKMEEPGGTLPESVFEKFHDRLDAAAAATSRKRFPMAWALVPAFAAGLAAILILRQPTSSPDSVQIIEQTTAPVAMATSEQEKEGWVEAEGAHESEEVAGTEDEIEIGTEIETESETGNEPEGNLEITIEPAMENEPENGQESNIDTEPDPATEASEVAESLRVGSPYTPKTSPSKPVGIKVVPATGIITGGGLLAALAVTLANAGMKTSAGGVYETNSTGEPVATTATDELSRSEHNLPFRAGLSVGIPLSERWKVTSGLEYSLYKSSFTYSLSGEKKQLAHYLGIPVRLDWSLAKSKRFDVYLGAGIEGDYCIGATLAGESIARDGFSFSLLGTGGVQFNVTKGLGLYVEPGISWTVPSQSSVLETYRSGNPLMFSISTGIRINL